VLARHAAADRALIRLIVATRFSAKTRRFVGAFNQNAVFELETGRDTIDAYLRRASLTALESYQHCEYDPRLVESMVADLAAERGIDTVGYCFFNDMSFGSASAPTIADTTPEGLAECALRLERLRADTELSVPVVEEVPKGATFFLSLERLDDHAVLQLCLDHRFLASSTPLDFLRDLEELAVSTVATSPDSWG
jgi:hypothetical protein